MKTPNCENPKIKNPNGNNVKKCYGGVRTIKKPP